MLAEEHCHLSCVPSPDLHFWCDPQVVPLPTGQFEIYPPKLKLYPHVHFLKYLTTERALSSLKGHLRAVLQPPSALNSS